MKVYVTRYALSHGVLLLEASRCEDDPSTVRVSGQCGRHSEYYCKNDWHLTWDAALYHAHEMRLAAIKSKEKSLAKLKAMTFKEPK